MIVIQIIGLNAFALKSTQISSNGVGSSIVAKLVIHAIYFTAEFGCANTRFNEIFINIHFYEKS